MASASQMPLEVLHEHKSACLKEITRQLLWSSGEDKASVDKTLLARASGYLYEQLQAVEAAAQVDPSLFPALRKLRNVFKPLGSWLPLSLVSLCCDVQTVDVFEKDLTTAPADSNAASKPPSTTQHLCWLHESGPQLSRAVWDRYGGHLAQNSSSALAET
jgi:hypothetical protein